MNVLEDFSDEDARRVIYSAMRLVAILAVVLTPLIWWKLGWKSAALLWVGAVISASGLWKWLRLMNGVMRSMDAGAQAKPMGGVIAGFLLQLAGSGVVLYVSLKFLDGSVYALAGGLGLGIIALSVEGLRAMKAWTI